MQYKYLRTVAVGLATMMALNSCQEHIDEGARFTFTGKTIATYLQGEAECSHFVEILTRGECIGLMKAYGMYTCFAPTNDAVEQFVKEQYAIYTESKKKYEETKGTPNETRIIDTGVYSDDWKELTDEKCGEIARNHILSNMYLRGDLIGTSVPEANMNDRDLTLDVDTLDGAPLINSTAKITNKEDIEVENGVVHILNGVVNPSSLNVPTLLSDFNFFSIFMEALQKTGYDEKIAEDKDKSYQDGDKIGDGVYKGQLAPYPANRKYGFTIFLEPNKVLNEYGVKDFASLEAKCKEWYPEFIDNDPSKPNMVWAYNEKNKKFEYLPIDHSASLTHGTNPVNQFVGYHLLDRKVSYSDLVCHKISVRGFQNSFSYDSEKNFPATADRTEYYVTMNNRILKVTLPLNSDSNQDHGKRFLNYGYSVDRSQAGPNVEVLDPNVFKNSSADGAYQKFTPEAVNGALNVINKVLLYDEKVMSAIVLNCIMRIDVASLCPELTNNGIRWEAPSLQAGTADGEVYIPDGYCDRIQMNTNDTRLLYLPPHYTAGWFNYQGDEMMALGLFDLAYCLPPLPEGDYEIRLGYTASRKRHVVQVYLDNEVTGLPIDLRLTGEKPQIAWESDDELGTAEAIAAKDKDMKNRGYMKAPDCFYYPDESKQISARDNAACLRAVIATKHLSAGSHWLRFKNVNEEDDGSAQFMHDYFEIVPLSYLRDENITLEEKRK